MEGLIFGILRYMETTEGPKVSCLSTGAIFFFAFNKR